MDINYYPLSRELGKKLKQAGMRLAVAESCTAGDLSRMITRVPGSAAWFECGFITYSNESKTSMLGVDRKLIKEHGAVSKEVAVEMAIGALNHSIADFSASITGIAGPDGGTPEKPVGTVWIAVALKNGHCEARKTLFESGRKHVRMCAATYALNWLIKEVENVLKTKELNKKLKV